MSSTTAAPRIVRPGRVRTAPSSASTAEVMPTLVATSAAAKNAEVAVSSPRTAPSAKPATPGEDDAEHGDEQRGAADGPQVRQPRLEADPEEQEDDAELGEHVEHLAEVDEPEHRRPDEDAREDLADDRRLVDPLEQLVAELRREQDDEDVGQRAGGVGGGGEREQQVRGHRDGAYAARAARSGARRREEPGGDGVDRGRAGPTTQSVSRLRTCDTVPTRSPDGSWMPIRAPT